MFLKKQKQRIYECHYSIWLAPDGFVYRRGSFIAWPVCLKTGDISVFKPNYGPSQTGNTTWQCVYCKLTWINWIESKTTLGEVIVSGVCQSWVGEKYQVQVQVNPRRGQPPPTLSSNCQFVASLTVDRITEAGRRAGHQSSLLWPGCWWWLPHFVLDSDQPKHWDIFKWWCQGLYQRLRYRPFLLFFFHNDFGPFWRSGAKKYCTEVVKVNIRSENILRGLDSGARVGVLMLKKADAELRINDPFSPFGKLA